MNKIKKLFHKIFCFYFCPQNCNVVVAIKSLRIQCRNTIGK